jgi:hypothetical protein
MLDVTGLQNLFDSVHRLWVEPELDRRREAGTLPDDFKIRRCLVRLPKDHGPIVEFNEEVTWQAKAKTAKGIEFVKGEPVHLPQVDYIESVQPPTHDGVRVAFLFLYWNGVGWQIVFDFTPNSPSAEYESDDDDEWELGRSIAEYLNQILREFAVHNHDVVQADIESIALWPAPALLPYPFSAICEHCRNNKHEDARTLLVDHCNTEFLTKLVGSWSTIPAFTDRSKLFSEALSAHRNRQYTLSVSALLPHIEGVITDWIHDKLPAADVPWKQQSKTKKFRDLVESGAQRTFVDQRVAQSVTSFILDGPVLETFTDWLSPVSGTFPNRNVVGHGKYDDTLYTEENSIKVLLILDTLYHIMSAHVTR